MRKKGKIKRKLINKRNYKMTKIRLKRMKKIQRFKSLKKKTKKTSKIKTNLNSLKKSREMIVRGRKKKISKKL